MPLATEGICSYTCVLGGGVKVKKGWAWVTPPNSQHVNLRFKNAPQEISGVAIKRTIQKKAQSSSPLQAKNILELGGGTCWGGRETGEGKNRYGRLALMARKKKRTLLDRDRDQECCKSAMKKGENKEKILAIHALKMW